MRTWLKTKQNSLQGIYSKNKVQRMTIMKMAIRFWEGQRSEEKGKRDTTKYYS